MRAQFLVARARSMQGRTRCAAGAVARRFAGRGRTPQKKARRGPESLRRAGRGEEKLVCLAAASRCFEAGVRELVSAPLARTWAATAAAGESAAV